MSKVYGIYKENRSKYGVRVDCVGKQERTLDGVVFGSVREMRRYQDLKLLELAGEIRHLTVHPRFPLIAWGSADDCQVVIGYYTADTMYETKEGHRVVEDVKSKATKTTAYMLRKKLMKANYGIEVQEC